MITIYNFPRGARGLRVAWLCEELGLAYDVRKLGFPTDAAYRQLNPLGSVPFLTDGDVQMNESSAMLLYLAERYGPTPFLPERTSPDFARVVQLTVFSEATLGAGLNVLMEARFGAPEADKDNWSVRAQGSRSNKALAFLEQMLGDRDYLAGDGPTIADLAVTTALGMRQGALGQAPSPRLAAYRENLIARPAYASAAERIA
jgi:glutathione S-transferase